MQYLSPIMELSQPTESSITGSKQIARCVGNVCNEKIIKTSIFDSAFTNWIGEHRQGELSESICALNVRGFVNVSSLEWVWDGSYFRRFSEESDSPLSFVRYLPDDTTSDVYYVVFMLV